jgi:acetate kinase
MDTILVTNAGSSSVKFEVFGVDQAGGLSGQLEGKIEGVGTKPHLTAKSAEGKVLVDRTYTNETVPHVPAALHAAAGWLRDECHIHPIAVGHRVVHGGPEFDQPVIVTEEVLRRLERYIPLAPLHQPHNLAPIRSIMVNRPGLPQVACFDTAFHRKHPAVADYYAIPEHFHAEGVRRYGFHGLSYEYIAARLPEVAPDIAKKRIVVAHLGSGASMCALKNGQSIESTMGFTALDGLPMGTRAGQIDPGVVLYLIEQKGMSPKEAQRLLYNDCGLKGLSGVSNDMRELEASGDPRAAFAIDYFVYRIALFAGTLAAALGGLDAFVFTAGIGENSAFIRTRVAAKLSWLGLKLDEAANAGGKQLISAPDGAVGVYVIPTDEELMIAQHTLALVRGS